MKKPLLLLVLLAAVALAVYFFFLQGGGGSVPVAAALDPEQTVGVAGVQDFTALWNSAKTVAEKLPQTKIGGVDLKLIQPSAAAGFLGFDPGTDEGWASIGLDPHAGLAGAGDARLMAAYGTGKFGGPVVLVRVTDRDKLMAFLAKMSGKKPVLTDGPDGITAVDAGGPKALMGKKGDITAFFPVLGDEAAARKAFAAFLAGGGSLAKSGPWQDAFDGAQGTIQTYAYLGSLGGLALVKSLGLGADVETVAEHYSKLFPAFAAYGTAQGGGGMLLGTPDAVHALEQIARPKKAPPAFSKFLPPTGAMAVRFSVNLVEVTAGVAALLPPNVPPQVRMGLEMGKTLLPMQAGFSWDDLTQAVSGHAALVGDLSKLEGNPTDAWLVLVGVQTPEKFDALMVKLMAAGKDKLGIESAPTEVAGAKGYHVEANGLSLVLVRKDDVLLVGTTAVVEAALKSGGTQDPAARMLDKDVVYGFYVDAAGLMSMMEKAPNADAQMVTFVKALAGDTAKNGGMAVDARIDAHGLRFETAEGAGASAAFMLGAAAAIAVPAFQKYESRSKGAEAQVNLQVIARGAVSFYEEAHVDQSGTAIPKQFPATDRTVTAPAGWHEMVCPGGQPTAYMPAPDTFEDPVFEQLGFKPSEPLRFQYTFTATGTDSGALFTARAIGDLNCDGVLSTFERTGHVASGGSVVMDTTPAVNEGE